MLKRFIDITFATVGLIFFLPIICIVVIIIWLTLGSPIIFQQVRPGIFGKPFTLYKFRTMTGGIDKNGNLLPDEMRISKFGLFLRKTSLDEIPQLFNVIRGDMSLVGPRPLLMEYLPHYSPLQFKRHLVKPGITGWAQVNGRNAISWTERFDLDLWYVENASVGLDFKILFMTLIKTFLAADVAPKHGAVVEKFKAHE